MQPTWKSQFAIPALSHVAGEESIFEGENCFLKEKKKKFIWLRWVLVAAHRIFVAL